MAELRRLHTAPTGRPALIFVHGLGGDAVDTWRHERCKPDDCWPHWVGRDCNCDVWALGYDSALSAWQGQAMPLPDQGDQVADLLATEPGLRAKPLALIGHSMGGLVIKTLLINGRTKGDPRVEEVVRRIVAIVFVATPHNGSNLASLASAVRWVLRTNEQVGNMRAHDAHLRGLNQQFRSAVQKQGIAVRAYAERQGVPVGVTWAGLRIPTGMRRQVVDASSADPGLPQMTTVPLAGDHFSICKPVDRNQQIHKSLCDFIANLPVIVAESQSPALGNVPMAVAAVSVPATPQLEVVMPRLAPSAEPGRLSGADDKRLQPREARLYGRHAEVSQVLEFLRGGRDAALVTALVAGVGGIGKTEVCKAALKRWLESHPDAVAYYVDLPDSANAVELVDRMARAVGLQSADTLQQLLPALPPALYYLDNLESVAESPEGQQVLRALKDQPGVRLLASSRVSLPGVLGKPIVVDVLPADEALQLFRDLWAGNDALPADPMLRPFVVQQLGAHALTVTLAARLGDCYTFAELQRRWQAAGAEIAQDPQDAQSRLGSLPVSLRLTTDALARHEGSLALWTVAALFATGVSDSVLQQLEALGGWARARPWLVRHHVLTRRGERWHMLPPLARYALDASLAGTACFDWATCREAPQTLFGEVANAASSIASTSQALGARAWLMDEFATLARLFQHDLDHASPRLDWLQKTHDALINQYQFRAALSRDVLARLHTHLARPASALQALGDLESRLGRPDEARGLYDRALVLYEKEQAGLGQANTLKALGDLESRLGRPDEARGLYDRALVLYEKEQAGLGQANTLQALGDLESRLGRPDEARGLYDRALVLYEKEQAGLGQANTLQALGDLQRAGANHAQAVKTYQRALALYAKEQEPIGTAYTFAELARCLHALRKEGLRDEALRSALDAAERAHVGSVSDYVFGALVEVTGGPAQACAWMARLAPGAT
ncbi:MAG: tetratricopeptide repeat protein [Candidatus Accumulibacter sp.]|nr:tetratricopeptide repeat protein [Candidatus Accumulibacter conexus]